MISAKKTELALSRLCTHQAPGAASASVGALFLWLTRLPLRPWEDASHSRQRMSQRPCCHKLLHYISDRPPIGFGGSVISLM